METTIMAKNKIRTLVKMISTESSHVYWTQKNKRSDNQRLELHKYDPTMQRHVLYREAK
jgi:large subunit ribosomal protein L33